MYALFDKHRRWQLTRALMACASGFTDEASNLTCPDIVYLDAAWIDNLLQNYIPTATKHLCLLHLEVLCLHHTAAHARINLDSRSLCPNSAHPTFVSTRNLFSTISKMFTYSKAWCCKQRPTIGSRMAWATHHNEWNPMLDECRISPSTLWTNFG